MTEHRKLSRPEQLLKDNGYTTKFYYLRYCNTDQFNRIWCAYRAAEEDAKESGTEPPKKPVPVYHPRITVCLAMQAGLVAARGVAICVLPDNPSRKLGRKLAARRAFEATFMAARHKSISASQAAKHVIREAKGGRDLAHRIFTGNGFALSVREPALTELEEKLITKPKEKKDDQQAERE